MAELTYPTSIDLNYIRHNLDDLVAADATGGSNTEAVEPTSIDLAYLKLALDN